VSADTFGGRSPLRGSITTSSGRALARPAEVGPDPVLVQSEAQAAAHQCQERDGTEAPDVSGRLPPAPLEGARAKQPYAIGMKDGSGFGLARSGGAWGTSARRACPEGRGLTGSLQRPCCRGAARGLPVAPHREHYQPDEPKPPFGPAAKYQDSREPTAVARRGSAGTVATDAERRCEFSVGHPLYIGHGGGSMGGSMAPRVGACVPRLMPPS